MTISITRLIYVAMAALVAMAVWVLTKTGKPAGAEGVESGAAACKPHTRYAELVAARRDVERRIERLQLYSDARGGSEFSHETLESLRAIRAGIEAELAELQGGQ
jgi:hypothetical protein